LIIIWSLGIAFGGLFKDFSIQNIKVWGSNYSERSRQTLRRI